MNGRIKELATQAWKYANETVGHREFGYHDAFEQKFAELLIKECASAVNSRDDSDTGFWANIIKEHFGVEE